MPRRAPRLFKRLLRGSVPRAKPDYRRRLEVTVPGRWYIALTIGLGVVALISGNNVLYLIESLLLSGMIYSGVLSERAVSAVKVDWVRGRAIAGENLPDRIRITNTRRSWIYCLEIGVWRGGRSNSIAYIARLGPKETVTLPARANAGARGKESWDGLAIGTAYPFGFARKLRILHDPGERVIWPARAQAASRSRSEGASRSHRSAGGDLSDGEIRPYDPQQDDSRWIVWPLSLKGQAPMVRVRKRDSARSHLSLDLRRPPGEEFERDIRQVAAVFHESDEGSCPMLTIVETAGRRRLSGRVAALDELARIQAQGGA